MSAGKLEIAQAAVKGRGADFEAFPSLGFQGDRERKEKNLPAQESELVRRKNCGMTEP